MDGKVIGFPSVCPPPFEPLISHQEAGSPSGSARKRLPSRCQEPPEVITSQVARHADVLELRAGIPGRTCLVLGQTLFLELG